ncbi:hypothetical protein AYL99_11196 [Fonsecaea erecta]|uniref:Uncharacterized protein n=1 Tax=Fonsecaea erecta TaxID=1367422 RepID=A0A178Z4R2_9EURO|nr:hypothetical protein AYL99_11196 [Fonsecaea erecta]OAP54748.1 hypothetical protein AYL99_11196 [Fonsecaea erecta]
MGVLQQTLPLSLLYFSLVFTSGLILDSVRVPYLQPLLGARYAELFEMPIVLVVTWQAAQVTVWNLDGGAGTSSGEPKRRWPPPPTPLLVGALALVWLLAAELALSVVVATAAPEPPVYTMVALLAYAVMPWIAWLVQTQRDDADKLLWDFDETQAEQEDYCSR